MEKSPGFVGLFYLPATLSVFPLPAALIPILDYIASHPAADLTLEALGRRFYMNQSYLSRLFQKWTGSNIHEFIIYKRISPTKKLPTSFLSLGKTPIGERVRILQEIQRIQPHDTE
jgi:hypothetical protein